MLSMQTRQDRAAGPAPQARKQAAAARARASKICVRAAASTATPTNLVSAMPVVTGAPIFTSAARARARREPWDTQKEWRMCALNSTAMPRAIARFTRETLGVGGGVGEGVCR